VLLLQPQFCRQVRCQGPDRRKIEADARLLARSCGPEAVEELRTIMKDPAAPYMAKIIAANSLLDRGWGRPPVSVEVYEAVARPQEREGSAREIIESRLAELGARLRAEENPPKLLARLMQRFGGSAVVGGVLG